VTHDVSPQPPEPEGQRTTGRLDDDGADSGLGIPGSELGDEGIALEDERRAEATRRRRRLVVREFVETTVLALLVFLCVRASFQNFVVDGRSMSPTLENGQFLVVNKLVYTRVDIDRLSRFIPFLDAGSSPQRDLFTSPERGDIIVLKDPGKPDTDLVKRIIGLPGETLEIVDGHVYIDGHLLIEPYIKMTWQGGKPRIVIPPGEYFVMGDNRDASKDSRSTEVGLVPRSLIIGKAMLSYWPLSRFGLAPNESPDISTKDGRPQLSSLTLPDMVNAVGSSGRPAVGSGP
jgi:signal peptidase I